MLRHFQHQGTVNALPALKEFDYPPLNPMFSFKGILLLVAGSIVCTSHVRGKKDLVYLLNITSLFSGYTGLTCESCASGYRPLGDECVPCDCDARGAVSLRCDAHARCRCRHFATGDKCQLCAMRRHYLDEDGCKRK